jgi:signal transduction histidine kinase
VVPTAGPGSFEPELVPTPDPTHAATHAALERERARHQALAALGLDSLHGEEGRAAIVSRTLDAVRRLLPCDHVALLSVEADALEVLVATDPRGAGHRLPRAGSLADLAVREGGPTRSDDLRADPRLAVDARVLGAQLLAGWTVPMVVGDEVRVLSCVTTSPWEERVESEAFLQAAANLLVADDARRAAATAARTSEAALRDALDRERRATEELREVGEFKNALLAAVSHELRTPLTSVIGFAELLQRHDGDLVADRRQHVLTGLVRNARRLERLLGDLLDLDRLDRSVVEPVRRPTPVHELVARVLQRLDATDRRIHLDLPHVVATIDGPKVERIVENLLVNAVKHTALGSSIWVRVEPAADGLTLVVEDDGPGVPDALRESIFDAFVRGDGPHRSHSPGTGIGLSLVARFAALHGGRAWVDDRAGGGASFRVWLPDGPAERATGDLAHRNDAGR